MFWHYVIEYFKDSSGNELEPILVGKFKTLHEANLCKHKRCLEIKKSPYANDDWYVLIQGE